MTYHVCKHDMSTSIYIIQIMCVCVGVCVCVCVCVCGCGCGCCSIRTFAVIVTLLDSAVYSHS